MAISYERDNLLKKQVGLVPTDSFDEEGNFEWLGIQRQWRNYIRLKEWEEKDKMMPF